jgi:hypothetical protein
MLTFRAGLENLQLASPVSKSFQSISSAFAAIATAPSSVAQPPMKPEACTNTPPGMPVAALQGGKQLGGRLSAKQGNKKQHTAARQQYQNEYTPQRAATTAVRSQ